jgi:electron transfer flavoprotein beta subunit
MKIVVAVKRVVDPYVKIRVKPDQSGVELKNVKMTMNPFDEIAVEEAIRIREKQAGVEIILVSVGSIECQETLRHGLALGADRAILVRTEASYCSLNIAKILQKIVLDEKADLVLMGKQSIDGDNNQSPQMLAALLDWPQATYASNIQIDSPKVRVMREVDGGLETIEIEMPAVISTDLRLNEPRYASLPNIMKAKQKSLVISDIETLGLTLKLHTQRVSVAAPVVRSGGIRLASIDALIEKLKHEAKVLE